MKVLAIVPDAKAAYGLGDALTTLDGDTARVIAYGQVTAAALPAGLDVFVYPLRDGSRLPQPFVDALVQHEAPDIVVAPTGALRRAAVPVLFIDLDGRVPASEVSTTDEQPMSSWVEAVTATTDRRAQLMDAGLFCVEACPAWFDAPGKLCRTAGPRLSQKLRHVHRLAQAPANATMPPTSSSSMALLESPEPLALSAAPLELEHAAEPLPTAGSTAPAFEFLGAFETGAPLEDSAPWSTGAPASMAPPNSLPPASTPPTTPPIAPSPLGFAQPPVLPASAVPDVMVQDPESYRGRHAGSAVLVLASVQGLEEITPAQLAYRTVIAVPDTLAWLASRMGVAQFVALTALPRTLDAASALASARTIIVHDNALDAAAIAPRSRSRVPVLNLVRAGGPALGWSDELGTGFFPGPGDVALALQWAHWIGAEDILIAGIDPLEDTPHWPAFLRGARQILAERGIRFALLERVPHEAHAAASAGERHWST